MADSLWNGRTFRLLNIVDDYNQEVLHIESDTSIPTARLIRSLEMLKGFRGLPQMTRVDNGPELISAKLDYWCREHQITLTFIQPGKPRQSSYIERCNGSIRRELLNADLFQTLDEVRQKADEWRLDYNNHRPHKPLGIYHGQNTNPYPDPIKQKNEYLSKLLNAVENREAYIGIVEVG